MKDQTVTKSSFEIQSTWQEIDSARCPSSDAMPDEIVETALNRLPGILICDLIPSPNLNLTNHANIGATESDINDKILKLQLRIDQLADRDFSGVEGNQGRCVDIG